MRHDTHTQRVLYLVRQKGLVRPSDLDEWARPGGPDALYSQRPTGKGRARSLPAARCPAPVAREPVAIATKVPQAVFCLLTALQFHGLTTQLPRQVWIAMPRGSHTPRIDYPPIKMVQFSGDAYTAGHRGTRVRQVKLRVYGAAKTVADCFKHRNKIGLDVALEALKDARRQAQGQRRMTCGAGQDLPRRQRDAPLSGGH